MPDTLAQRVKAKYPGVYDDIPDAELDAKVRSKYPGVYDDIPQSVNTPDAPKPGSKAALIMQATAKAAPVVADAAVNFATSPAVPKMAATAGRIMGGVAPVVAGATKMGPTGAAIGMAGAAQGAWAGGKAGWFTGKLAQQLMVPIAKVADAVAPYAQALSTLSGAQGVLDLAQMAEPNRKDIGVLGMSMSGGRSDAEKQANPALLNQLFQSLEDKWHGFMGSYPKEVGKSSWNALNPTQRLEAFHTFMQKETGGG